MLIDKGFLASIRVSFFLLQAVHALSCVGTGCVSWLVEDEQLPNLADGSLFSVRPSI